MEGEKRELSGQELGHSERSPSKGTGLSGCPQGGDREIKLPLPWSQPEIRVRSKSRDCQACRTPERKRRHCRVWHEGHPAPYYPSRRSPESSEEAAAAEDLDLEEPPELELEVACFLGGSMGNFKEEDEKVPPKPPVEEFHKWVPWKAETCKMPSWWRELVAVPEVEDHKRLAWEVQASFQLPRRMRELHPRENCCQALPAPPCLHWKKFMPPASSIYACRDIHKIPQEKTVAYAQALQQVGQFSPPNAEAMPAGRKCEGAEGGVRVLPLLLL